MFGYVKVNSSELKVKEYEFYRGTYCGLCRTMGKCTGQCSRMTLNYDFVFLALIRLAIKPESISFSQKRCLAHPFKKRNSMQRNGVLDYCAAASAILCYQKIADDIADEKGFKRFRARLALPFAAHSRKKALSKAPALKELDASVEEKLSELAKAECADGASVDVPAAVFGELLGEIMAFGLEGSRARLTYGVGKTIGAWIYIADAIEDMPEDMKKGRFNPIIKLYGGRIPNEDELDSLYHAVRNHLFAAEAAFDLFDTEDGAIKNIIQNILYLGIPDMTEKIIKSTEQKGTKQSRKESSNDRSI